MTTISLFKLLEILTTVSPLIRLQQGDKVSTVNFVSRELVLMIEQTILQLHPSQLDRLSELSNLLAT